MSDDFLKSEAMENRVALGQEWTTLQNNYERYESGALLVKLAAVGLFFAGIALALEPWFICLVLLVLWLQEGIFKTYQSRLGERLLQVERSLVAQPEGSRQAFQLHTSWLAQRTGTAGLLAEYAASACRPTVAFPYAVLVLAGLVLSFLS